MKTVQYIQFIISITFLFTGHFILAQTYIPVDYHGEAPSQSVKYLENLGQLVQTDGNLAGHIDYYQDVVLPRTYLGDNDIYHVVPGLPSDSLDTLFRIRQQFLMEGSPVVCAPTAIDPDNVPRNYYLPHTGNGVEDVNGYDRIVYEEIYDDIDYHFFSNDLGIKTYFVIKPGGDPDDIDMKFTGQDAISASTNGSLDLYIQSYILEFEEMDAYEIDGSNTTTLLSWKPTYINQGNGEVTISCGTYNTNNTLVLVAARHLASTPTANPPIDNLIWCTSLPDMETDFREDVITDANNNIFVTGFARNKKFPFNNGVDFTPQVKPSSQIIGFKPDHQILFLCYIGSGGGMNDLRIDTDNNGHVFLSGWTNGGQLPVKGPSGSHQDNTMYTNKWFISKVLYTSTPGKLIWSTYVGGTSGGFNKCRDLGVDNTGAVYLVGHGITSMPTTALSGAYNSTSGYAAIYKFNSSGALIWGTRFGHTTNETHINTIHFDSQNRMILAGTAQSGALTQVNAGSGAYYPSYAGGPHDGFVTIFNTNLSIFHSTYIGGSDQELIYGIATDDQDNIYLSGESLGNGYIALDAGNNAYFDNTFNGMGTQSTLYGDGVFSKMDKNGVLLHSTYLGGRADEIALDIGVSSSGHIHITGSTTSDNFPMKTLNKAYQESQQSQGNDKYENGTITVFNSNLQEHWSTYFATTSSAAPSPFNTFALQTAMDISSNDRLYVFGTFSHPSFDPQFNPHDFPFVEYPGGYFDPANSIGWRGFISCFNVDYTQLGTYQVNHSPFDVSVFPNPANDRVEVKITGTEPTNGQLNLLDIQGKVLMSKKIGNNEAIVFNVANLANGTYILTFKDTRTLFIKQ